VIDLVGVKNAIQSETLKADGAMSHAVRASQFQNEPDAVTRVVFELARGLNYKVTRRGNSIDVAFSRQPGSWAPHGRRDAGRGERARSVPAPQRRLPRARATAPKAELPARTTRRRWPW
jgi:hypothetical protein